MCSGSFLVDTNGLDDHRPCRRVNGRPGRSLRNSSVIASSSSSLRVLCNSVCAHVYAVLVSCLWTLRNMHKYPRAELVPWLAAGAQGRLVERG